MCVTSSDEKLSRNLGVGAHDEFWKHYVTPDDEARTHVRSDSSEKVSRPRGFVCVQTKVSHDQRKSISFIPSISAEILPRRLSDHKLAIVRKSLFFLLIFSVLLVFSSSSFLRAKATKQVSDRVSD